MCKLQVDLMTALTFQAKRTNTGPRGTLRMYLLKPSCGSPGLSARASLLILSIYSPRATAVVTSLAVYAMGLPICSVSSFANSSCRELRRSKAFLTIFCRSARGVFLYDSKAVHDRFGRASSSEAEGPCRVTIGLLVIGEMVVIVSVAMVSIDCISVCWLT